ncbi:MAG: PQQ-dependent sugar dehydrogenase [Burkholderiales bacterium]|nr:PQQ-dependent sugar dehydrogenase [Burkholderiales bacterium]
MPRPRFACAGLALIAAALSAGPAAAQAAPAAAQPRVETVVAGLAHPWGLAFLPDGSMLVTERPGRLRVVSGGVLSPPVTGVPAVQAAGQGGLLDIALDPNFAANRLVYLSYAEPRADGSGTSVARGRLSADNRALENVEVIFRQMPTLRSNMHFGSRLAFDREGMLFVTLGDRFSAREQAQELNSHVGKIVRIRPEGGAAPGNPFAGRSDALPEIWSYGHRNIQAAGINPQTGRLWTIEHGARGGDEVNIPQAGKNYGWPVITYGVDYSGAKIGEGTAKPGMEQPVFYWDPSIAPSGLAFVTSDLYPGWKGSLLTGGLRSQLLARLQLSGNGVTREERHLRDVRERIRDVRQGPDGLIYLVTDDPNGKILRLRP